jgi:hypothetical protein
MAPGTGKSVLLREIIRTMGGSMSSTLAITASTGIASVNIGGNLRQCYLSFGILIFRPRHNPALLGWNRPRTRIGEKFSREDSWPAGVSACSRALANCENTDH